VSGGGDSKDKTKDESGEGTDTRMCRCKKDRCLDRGSNTGPLDLQSNALPTELSKQLYEQ
jgi:hypothetical protein